MHAKFYCCATTPSLPMNFSAHPRMARISVLRIIIMEIAIQIEKNLKYLKEVARNSIET